MAAEKLQFVEIKKVVEAVRGDVAAAERDKRLQTE